MSDCHRCSECQNCDHHWLDNPRFGMTADEIMEDRDDAELSEIDQSQAERLAEATHLCQHCPQLGVECDECDGTGQGEYSGVDEDGTQEFDNCEICHGEGVIPTSTPETEGQP